MTPEKLHLVTNHFPIIGSVVASAIFLIGLVLRNKPLLFTGIGTTLATFLVLGVIMDSGEKAYERYSEGGEISSYITPEGKEMLKQHEEIAHKVSKLGYLNFVLALIGGAFIIWKKKGLILVSSLLLLLNITFFLLSIKVSDSGGKIRRPDFINKPA